MTPSRRKHADKFTDHHLLWTEREWSEESQSSSRLRVVQAMLIPTLGLTHDILHERIRPLRPPSPLTCDIAFWACMGTDEGDQLETINSIAYQLGGEASANRNPERSDELLELSYHLLAQTAILGAGR